MPSPSRTPISPPTLDPTSPPASESAPISPVTRATTFQHASAAGVVSTTTPFIETNTPAINENAPVELDGVATSPEELRRRMTGEAGKEGVAPGLDEEDDIAEEFLGEPGVRGVGRVTRENRAAFLASRSKDPGVIVDLPVEPTAEEVEAAKSADGAVTPGLLAEGSEGRNKGGSD